MKAKILKEKLIENLNKMPTAKVLATILRLGDEQAIYSRMKRDSEFSDEEIELLEDHFAIDLRGNTNCIKLNYYPDVFGSCGNGSMVFSETAEKIDVTKSLINNYSASNKYSVINARGSSMAPLIQNEDYLIVEEYKGEQIVDDDIYVFRYNDELFVKRLAKNIDQILVISENKQFENRVINLSENNFQIIGKIVGLFRTKI